MATRVLARSLLATNRGLFSAMRRYFSSSPVSAPPSSLPSLSTFSLLRLRPLVAVAIGSRHASPVSTGARGFATRPTTSSLNDSSPNWSNRPPKETILLDGCDFEHWLVVVEKPEGDPTRDEIIDSYIKTLAQVVGSEEDARMKIYSVSTRCYYAFGALVSEELSYKIKELPRVRWVLPDSYLDVKNKDYGGEPFINGQAVPYDPKYHEEWIRNNARANERNRRNDRPRNFDRSRNFERRRENMQNRGFQGNMGASVPNNMGPPPLNNAAGPPPDSSFSGPPPPGYNAAQNAGPPPGYNAGQNAGPPPGYNAGQNAGPPPGTGQNAGPPPGYNAGQNAGLPPGYNPGQNVGPPPGYNAVQNSGPPPGYIAAQNSRPPPGLNVRSPPGYNAGPTNAGPPPGYNGGQPNAGPPPGYNEGPQTAGPPPGYNEGPPTAGPPTGYSRGLQPGHSGGPPNAGPPPAYNAGQTNTGPSAGFNAGPPPNYYNRGPPNAGPPPSYSGGPQVGGGMPMPNNGPNYPQRNGPYQSGPGPINQQYQNGYGPSTSGGNPYQTQDVQGRDAPPSN